MLNRKGQSLVLFVLLIPIILGILVLVIDVGNALVLKNGTDNVIEMVMDIALQDNLDSDNITKLLDYNLEDNNNTVSIVDGEINIKSSNKIKGIFSKLFGFGGFDVESEYVGRMVDNKKAIVKKK